MREKDVIQIVDRCIDGNARIGRIESDVSTLKVDVATLKGDVATLKGDVAALRDDHRSHGIILEDLRSDMNKLIEVVMENSRKLDSLTDLRPRVEWHTDRLDAVEDGLRRHVRNRRVHRSVLSRDQS